MCSTGASDGSTNAAGLYFCGNVAKVIKRKNSVGNYAVCLQMAPKTVTYKFKQLTPKPKN